MCGISGLFNVSGVDPSPIDRMTRALDHRGPDDRVTRVWRSGDTPYAALGATRLAIVDVDQGGQPASDMRGRYHVVLNGEIYNHRRLRRELEANGQVFRSAGSDTEVAAQLIAAVGLRTALSRLHGMFSLAVLDTLDRTLHVVRDRMGVKPLYWMHLPGGGVAFSSELRSLRLHPSASATLDRRALQAYLLFEYLPTPWTAWSGCHKLEPGTALTVDANGVTPWRWWTPPVPVAGDGGDLDKWAKSLMGALQVATLQRMDADVEVGLLLSGGLDSSTITALAQRKSGRPLRTFSIAVAAAGFDESAHARRVAAALGTEHREARLDPADLPRILDEIATHMDEPLADSSLVATWRLMELVRDAGLKCVLSGDGADESLAGYPTALAHKLAPMATPFRGAIGRLADRLPTRFDGVTRDYKARRFAAGLGHPWARRHQRWMGAWLPEELADADPQLWQIVDDHAAVAAATDPVSRALYLDQRMYLIDGVLVKVDRASMAHGVEVRSPFMDHTVVELCASMGADFKLNGRRSKHVLKRAVADLLPPEVAARPKQGFGTPVGPWLRGPCRPMLDGLAEQVEGLVPGDTVRTCIREHLDGVRDHRRRLWSAVNLARWRAGPWGGR